MLGWIKQKNFSKTKHSSRRTNLLLNCRNNSSRTSHLYSLGTHNNKKIIFQKNSSIVGSGEGVFLLHDAPENRVVSLFSGLFYDYPVEAGLYNSGRVNNVSRTAEYRRASKKYSLKLYTYQTIINIPPELDLPGIFHPTFGPKLSLISSLWFMFPFSCVLLITISGLKIQFYFFTNFKKINFLKSILHVSPKMTIKVTFNKSDTF